MWPFRPKDERDAAEGDPSPARAAPTAGDPDPIAVRVALRAFSGLADIGMDTYWRHRGEKGHTTVLVATRAVFVSWASLLYSGVTEEALASARTAIAAEIAVVDEALVHFYADHAGMNDYGIGAMQDGAECARRVLALAAWAIGWPLQRPPGDRGRPHFDPLDTLAGPGDRRGWFELQRLAVARDRERLEGGLAVRGLMLGRLWQDEAAEAREIHLALSKWRRLADLKVLGDAIVGWFLERRPGALVLGGSPEAAEERVVRIANLPPAFWEGRAPEDLRYGLDYALHAHLGNPAWGAVRPSLLRLLDAKDATRRT